MMLEIFKGEPYAEEEIAFAIASDYKYLDPCLVFWRILVLSQFLGEFIEFVIDLVIEFVSRPKLHRVI